MQTDRRKISGFSIFAMLIMVTITVPAVGQTSAEQTSSDLSQEEQQGYLQWLHSLEQEVSARLDKGLEENNRLFPFDHDVTTIQSATPYRHLTIAKALAVLEKQFQDPRQAKGLSALVALANGRNYVNLTEYDSALVWFDVAAQRDTVGDFRSELKIESLAAAIAADDSSRMVERVEGLIQAGVGSAEPEELTLALRWCLSKGDPTQLEALTDTLWAGREDLSSHQLYWLTRALNQSSRTEQVYAELKILIRNGGLSLGLTESQRAWVLTTMADVSYLLGNDAQARKLYSTLMESPLPNLKLWSTYQLAGMDLAVGEYLAAETGYGAVCRAQSLGSWHEQACAMEEVTKEMERIRREGEPYGTSRFYNP